MEGACSAVVAVMAVYCPWTTGAEIAMSASAARHGDWHRKGK
jgi:hypothetical protein